MDILQALRFLERLFAVVELNVLLRGRSEQLKPLVGMLGVRRLYSKAIGLVPFFYIPLLVLSQGIGRILKEIQ